MCVWYVCACVYSMWMHVCIVRASDMCVFYVWYVHTCVYVSVLCVYIYSVCVYMHMYVYIWCVRVCFLTPLYFLIACSTTRTHICLCFLFRG